MWHVNANWVETGSKPVLLTQVSCACERLGNTIKKMKIKDIITYHSKDWSLIDYITIHLSIHYCTKVLQGARKTIPLSIPPPSEMWPGIIHHQRLWEETWILDCASHTTTLLIKKAIHISFRDLAELLNRDQGLDIDCLLLEESRQKTTGKAAEQRTEQGGRT